jgi:hypothetical protein
MSDIKMIGTSPKITILHPKNNAITATDGSNWKSALDMLKELVNDIEKGRVSAPEIIYVAMQTRHSINRDMVAIPGYCWAEQPGSGISMIGLLVKHQNKLLNPAR